MSTMRTGVVLLALLGGCLAAPARPSSFYIPAGVHATIYVIGGSGPGGVLNSRRVQSGDSSESVLPSTRGGSTGTLFTFTPFSVATPPPPPQQQQIAPVLHSVFTPTNPTKTAYVSGTQPGEAQTVLALPPPDSQTLNAAVNPEQLEWPEIPPFVEPELPQVPPIGPAQRKIHFTTYGLPNERV